MPRPFETSVRMLRKSLALIATNIMPTPFEFVVTMSLNIPPVT